MKKGFKRAGYSATVVLSVLTFIVLLISTAASFLRLDIVYVLVGQTAALVFVLSLMIVCIMSKKMYNSSCTKFAEYIVNNRQKEASRNQKDAEMEEKMRVMQENVQNAAYERETAVAGAYAQGRNDGMVEAAQITQEFNTFAPPMPVVMPMNSNPSEQVFYNEFGQPVLVRRKVKKGIEPTANTAAEVPSNTAPEADAPSDCDQNDVGSM